MKKKLFNNIIIVVVLVIFFAFVYFKLRNPVENIGVKSVVIKTSRDYGNHGTGTIQMKNGEKLNIRDESYYKIRIGDSLVKEKNSELLTIIRNDSVFYINFTK